MGAGKTGHNGGDYAAHWLSLGLRWVCSAALGRPEMGRMQWTVACNSAVTGGWPGDGVSGRGAVSQLQTLSKRQAMLEACRLCAKRHPPANSITAC